MVDAFWELVGAEACVAFVSNTCDGAVPKISIYTCQESFAGNTLYYTIIIKVS